MCVFRTLTPLPLEKADSHPRLTSSPPPLSQAREGESSVGTGIGKAQGLG
jgi:hypothetical protein